MLAEIIDKAKRILPECSSYPKNEIRVTLMKIQNPDELVQQTAGDRDYMITIGFRKIVSESGVAVWDIVSVK